MRHFAFAAALIMTAASCVAQDTPEKGKFVDLFNGKDLNGWKIVHCGIEVQDGAIFMKSGNGVVRPDRKFKDYVLELEWKALKADDWDSGIYIRCTDPDGTFPWPKKYQINLRKGMEGNCDELKGAKSKGLTRDGEWNKFTIRVVGTTCALEINGKPAWKADGLTDPAGYISLQAEVPGGGQFLFKNIRIQELTPAD